MVLIAVPGYPVSNSNSDLQWIYQRAYSPSIQQAVEAQYPTEECGPGECLTVEQYQHGWPLPCLDRGIGRSVILTPIAGVLGGSNEAFVRGHPRTSPLLSARLPGEHDSLALQPTPDGKAYETVHQEWVTLPILWSDYNRWPLTSDASEWRPGALLINLVVCLSIPLAAAGATQWWVRRRGGALRLRLVDLFIAVTFCCAVLAWRQSHVNLRQVELQIETVMHPRWFLVHNHLESDWERRQSGQIGYSCYLRRYGRPDWLCRLLGHQDFLRFTKHLVELQLAPTESWRDSLEVLPELSHLESASLPRGTTRQAINRLAELPRLRRLYLGVGTPALQADFEQQTGLSAERLLTAQDLEALRSLPIRELSLLGPDLLAEDLEPVLSQPTLERLKLVEASITPGELARLRKENPRLEIVCVWGEHVKISSRFSSPEGWWRFEEVPPSGMDRRIESIKQRRAASSNKESDSAEGDSGAGSQTLGLSAA